MFEGVSEPVEQLSPDGRVVILPREMWAEQLQAVVDGVLDGDRVMAAHLLSWDAEHHVRGPKRAASPQSYGPSADCPNCHIVGPGKKAYCEVHRCRATTSRGRPCPVAAREESGFLYCTHHGCHGALAPGVGCTERSVNGQRYCDTHLPDYICNS